MSRYIVTGCAGFIGSHVTDALLSRGDEVLGIDNFDDFYPVHHKWLNLAAARLSDRFQLYIGDIRDGHLLRRAFETFKPDFVIHLAARAGVRPSLVDPALYDDVNVRGTTMVLDEARRHAIRNIVLASSSSVYGATSVAPFSEVQPADRPASPYAASKRANELSAYAVHHLYGVPISCLRFFTAYGPRQRPEMAIHKFARQIDHGEDVTLYGDGSSTRDYTYIDDIVAGVLAASDRCSSYHIYNLGTHRLTKLTDLVALIGERVRKPVNITFLPGQAGDVPTTFADTSLAERELGYTPNTSLESGLDRFIEWYWTLATATAPATGPDRIIDLRDRVLAYARRG